LGTLTIPDCWAGLDPDQNRAAIGLRLSWQRRRRRRWSVRLASRSVVALSWRSSAAPCHLGQASRNLRTRRAPTRSLRRTSHPSARPSGAKCIRSGHEHLDPPRSRTASPRYWSGGRAEPSPVPIRPCCPAH